MTAGYAHDIELQPQFSHQLLLLLVYLFQEAASYRSHTADEEVEYLIFGEEEGVVDDVESLAKKVLIDDKGDV